MVSISMDNVDTHTQINVQETQICPFLKIFFWKELIIIE